MALLKGKPCPEFFEFLQKEEGIGELPDLHLCSVGHLSRLPAVHSFPGSQAPLTASQ